VGISVGFLGLLVTALVAVSRMYQVERRSRLEISHAIARYRVVNDFLKDTLSDSAEVRRGGMTDRRLAAVMGPISILSLLDRAENRAGHVSSDLDTEAEIRAALGKGYYRLGEYFKAISQFEKVLSVHRSTRHVDDSQIMADLTDLGCARRWRGDLEGAFASL